jgi:hypothetical protein
MHQASETFRYNRLVFVAPPWQEIFHPDRERKQDFNEAVRTHEAMVATYTECGYELVELPRASVEERMEFVIREIGRTHEPRRHRRASGPRRVPQLPQPRAFTKFSLASTIESSIGGMESTEERSW